jgi:hypothetical protein
LVHSLAPSLLDELDAIGSDSIKQMYLRAISTCRALIILDDLNTKEEFETLVPPEAACKFLITSRTLPNVRRAGVQEYELDLLGKHDAERLLRELCPSDSSSAKAFATLIDELGLLPLGIVLTAGVISETKITVEQYLSDFRASRDLSLLHDILPDQENIVKSFEVSYLRLRSDTHRALFRVAGIFDRTPIPLPAMAHCLSMDISTILPFTLGLKAHGLFETLEGSEQVSIHPLLWRFSHQLISSDDLPTLHNRAAFWFAAQISFRDCQSGLFRHGHPFTEKDLEFGQIAVRQYANAKNWMDGQAILEGIADPLTRMGRQDELFRLIQSVKAGRGVSDWLNLYESDLILSDLAPGDEVKAGLL